jgi:ParB family chromosome partitioning protein
MAQRKGGLGRGLSALIQSQGEIGGVQEVEVAAIGPNPYQPREAFDDAALEGLAASIRELGVLQPVIVSRSQNGAAFQLLAGERRWRAARLAGLRTIPAIIRETTPRQMLEVALIENVQRADLSVLEEAAAYRQLVDDFGLTQAEVGERVGKSRVAVTNALRVLAAPEEIRAAIVAGQITEGHARALLGLPHSAEQVAALELVIARGLSVRETEKLVRGWQSQAKPTARRPEPPIAQRRLTEAFQRALGTKVDLQRGRKGGRLVIHYFSDEELDGLYHRIVGDDEL